MFELVACDCVLCVALCTRQRVSCYVYVRHVGVHLETLIQGTRVCADTLHAITDYLDFVYAV